MRKLLIKELIKLNNNKKIYLIINDLGFSVIEPFKDKFPNRIFNAGVSEQNMMGMAAGIASEKCNVFVYSIANFSTFNTFRLSSNLTITPSVNHSQHPYGVSRFRFSFKREGDQTEYSFLFFLYASQNRIGCDVAGTQAHGSVNGFLPNAASSLTNT